MNISTILDLSIKNDEIGALGQTRAYVINERRYENYIDNETWDFFVKDMRENYPSAFAEYGEGAGDELGIKKAGKYPPKMASYGSSSRMIYLLSRDIPGFCFEKKLATTVGGTAHMDGYLQTESTQLYIEAKCREPYSTKSFVIDRKYEDLYRYIDSSEEVNMKCGIVILDEEKMNVKFTADNMEISRFDIKQMISHLLGIATSQINCPTNRDIRFLYLLYNPTLIHIEDEKSRNQISSIYATEIRECDSIPFADLFKVILQYLVKKRLKPQDFFSVDGMAARFRFARCDQATYKNLINP